MGVIKGKTAIKLFKSYPAMRKKPYWGNHFWARGYCVSTVGLDEQTIRDYIRNQEEEEKRQEQLTLGGLQPPSSPKKKRGL